MKPQHPSVPSCLDAKRVVVGTAGHIDHGKTALVYALTGTNTDRLPEEKQRGISIDLGFASLQLKDTDGRPLHLSFIDVPGHQAFIRNMLAGTGGIDCVLLVIAADEGVKAQTVEHLAICRLLGIDRGLVALTKCDAVSSERLDQAKKDIAEFLGGTFLEGAPVVPVSALSGTGIETLRQALVRTAAAVPVRSQQAVLRLPLDRSFSVRGFGTVVTGTLQAGTVRVGDTLEQHPRGRMLRVRGVQMHGSNCDAAIAPCRVALNLAGVEVAEIGRGDTLAAPRTLAPVRTVDIALAMLPDAPPLKHGSRVRAHAFTSDCVARILFYDQKDSRDSGSNVARLQLAKPMLLVPGDRIVLRQCSPAVTIGGGTVLDVSRPPRVRKSAALELLKQLLSAGEPEQLRLRVGRRGREGIAIAALVAETGCTAEALCRRMAFLIETGAVVNCHGQDNPDACWIAAEALAAAVQATEEVLTQSRSLSLAELRSRSRLNAPVFAAALQRMASSGKYEVQGQLARVAGSGDLIPEGKRRQLQALEALYLKQGLAAPGAAEVARQLGFSPQTMRELVTHLLRARRLVRMGADDAFVHAAALEELYAKLRSSRGQTFDVGRFKSFTGLTRKHAIPLLEHLDQARVTRNHQGVRTIL